MKRIEEITEEEPIGDVFVVGFYKRPESEEFLFDKEIMTLTEETICINGWIQNDKGDYRRLNQQGYVDQGVDIRFEVFMGVKSDLYKWKVKNVPGCIQPRGEITDGGTLNPTEKAVYKGAHYVESYAIKDNICVAKARQNVVLLRGS
jgi:hypothetical protein